MNKYKRNKLIALRFSGKSYEEISEQLGLSLPAIKSFCSRHDLTYKDIKNKCLCPNCGALIDQIPGRKQKRFCSDKCRYAWWNSNLDKVNRKANYDFTCAGCGKPFTAYGNKNRKYCSHACYIAARYGKRNALDEFAEEVT